MRKGGCISPVLVATRKLHQRGIVTVIPRLITSPLVIVQFEALDQQVPEICMDKIAFFVRMQAWSIETLGEQGIFFEPSPQHGKIVQDIQLRQVKTLPAGFGWQVLNKIDDLTFPGGWSAYQDE